MRNRASFHQAKDQRDLLLTAAGLNGRLTSCLEFVSVRGEGWCASLILGVTNEIAHHKLAQHGARRPVGPFGNSTISAPIPLLTDSRCNDRHRSAFICGVFSAWDGLDKLTRAVYRRDLDRNGRLEVNLINKLSETQIEQIKGAQLSVCVFDKHGELDEKAYQPNLTSGDAGIGSLAIERQSLNESKTLKVWEVLAMKQSIYWGLVDAACPHNFACYPHASDPSGRDTLSFAQTVQPMNGEDMASFATPNSSIQDAMIWVANCLACLRTPLIGGISTC